MDQYFTNEGAEREKKETKKRNSINKEAQSLMFASGDSLNP